MKNLWNDKEAANYPGDLGQRVYTSRLLGRDTTLVLHGGGNTSVKSNMLDVFENNIDVLYIKGSGWDLATIEAQGFAPVHLHYAAKLAQLETLSDSQMVNELKTHMLDSSAPTPSVETILHAIIPDKFVDHTHADAIVTITNTAEGEQRIRDIFGDSLIIIPYVMPGFDLARLCAVEFQRQRHAGTVGMILMNHGIFSFGDNARQSYDRMIELVSKAEQYLQEQKAWQLTTNDIKSNTPDRKTISDLRHKLCLAMGGSLIMRNYRDQEIMTFIRRDDIKSCSQQGPATPDHVIRTKRLPLLGADVDKYMADYKTYFNTHDENNSRTMLDPLPRVMLDQDMGLFTLGHSAGEATVIHDIYRHTTQIISRAQLLGGYQALPAKDIFDVEYWELEQAKLKKQKAAPVFQGEIALITGAASGIGRACVDHFLEQGAAVIALDINPAVENMINHHAYLGITCDLSDTTHLQQALDTGISHFGGLDMLLLNAGMFPAGCTIAEMNEAQWQKVMSINLDVNMVLLRECHHVLRNSYAGGRVVIIGSKNVPAPGPGAAAYSCSKAALNQLMRVAALEWGKDNIRINSIHPNMVFDTAIWTEEVLESRAKHYGLSVEEYKTNNVLRTKISSMDVAAMAAAMCSPLFAKTTASQVPIDGGNERVI